MKHFYKKFVGKFLKLLPINLEITRKAHKNLFTKKKMDHKYLFEFTYKRRAVDDLILDKDKINRVYRNI